MKNPILEVKNLTLMLSNKPICKDISFSLNENEILGLIGKSGSGKTVLAQGILRLSKAKAVNGQVLFLKEDLLLKNHRELSNIYGKKISMVFQDPTSSLNPTMKIGLQITEAFENENISFKEAKKKAIGLMNEVGIDHSEKRFCQYPHQLSGGICQRICIAIAIALNPRMIVFDEPTTALDTTLQLQVLRLIKKICRRHRISLFLITHKLGIIAKMCNRVLVINEGEIIEQGSVENILYAPFHPITNELIHASTAAHFPSVKASVDKNTPPLLTIKNLSTSFLLDKKKSFALKNINLTIFPKTTLALVGESGAGKTTLANVLVKLIHPSSGSIVFEKTSLFDYPEKQLRKEIQILFQNPTSSLNPLLTIRKILQEPLKIQKQPLNDQILERLLDEVKLPPSFLDRYPHELSGGEIQRICIARALSLKPKLLILDEPTSALDGFLQREIISLLRSIQEKHGLTYLLITHNFSIIKGFADEIAVMYLGQIIEKGSCDKIIKDPKHPFTQALLDSILSIDTNEKNRDLFSNLITPPVSAISSMGCQYHTRCPHASDICRKKTPLAITADNHTVFCHLYTKNPHRESISPKPKRLINLGSTVSKRK